MPLPLNALVKDDGSQLSKAQLITLLGAAVKTVVTYQVPAGVRVRERFAFPGDKDTTPDGYKIAFAEGDRVTDEELNALFPTATVTGVLPATGAAAGGTAVTIKGTNFAFGSTVSIGGVAATNVVVVDSTTITCTTGAHAAGAVNAIVTTPAGASPALANAYTYA